MKRDFLDYVEDVIEAMTKAQNFVKDLSYEDFSKDDKTVYAVIRAIEIIGEATKKIPPSVKKNYPQIPWKEMAGMRDKLIHEYFGVNLRAIFDTTRNEIPPLKSVFEKIRDDFSQRLS